MPVGGFHHLCNHRDVFVGNQVVEKVAHRIYKHDLGAGPQERFFEFGGDQPQIEAALVRVSRNSTEALRKSFGIAVLTSGADFGAASHWIPSRLSPLDFGMIAHV